MVSMCSREDNHKADVALCENEFDTPALEDRQLECVDQRDADFTQHHVVYRPGCSLLVPPPSHSLVAGGTKRLDNTFPVIFRHFRNRTQTVVK